LEGGEGRGSGGEKENSNFKRRKKREKGEGGEMSSSRYYSLHSTCPLSRVLTCRRGEAG